MEFVFGVRRVLFKINFWVFCFFGCILKVDGKNVLGELVIVVWVFFGCGVSEGGCVVNECNGCLLRNFEGIY